MLDCNNFMNRTAGYKN